MRCVRPLVERFLAERGLQPSPRTRHISTHIDEGFDFLGHSVSPLRVGKALANAVASKNTRGFLEKDPGHPRREQIAYSTRK